jgi:large subunit ribosomal protein L1
MDKKDLLKALETIKKESPERKFNQSVDFTVALTGLDFKKPEHQVEFFLSAPHEDGKKTKVCAFVGTELKDEADKVFDMTIHQDDFKKYDKKAAKKLANQFDFFVAQATIMPKVAATFGRYLGVRGKMPNPKAGCVVPPKGANLAQLYERLQKTIKISAKKIPLIQLRVGTQENKPEDVAENISYIYNQIVHHLPAEKNNIKAVYLKLTMGKPVKLDK